ncbi:MAG: hypothetical protein CL927_10240 [Deltaproteobacteria bacterium]|nr:hypothetical protein [Deltaproteobacteria bacterium]
MEPIQNILQTELVSGNTVGHFAGFGVAIFCTLLLAKITQWFFDIQLKKLTARSETVVDDVIAATLARPAQLIVLLLGAELSLQILVLPEWVSQFITNTTTVVVAMLAAFTASRLVDALYQTLVLPWVEKSDTRLDDQIVPIVMRACKVTIWVMAALITFSNLGYDIVSLLTGLGIGGLAVAMAAQDTLANVFGSVTIFADRPFQIGDLVEITGNKGVVEEVGLRTSRIRTMEGALITVPNREMAAHAVTNFSTSGRWRYAGSVGLVYDTPAVELRRAVEALAQIVNAHPHVEDGGARFMEFGDSALGIGFAYFVTEPNAGRYLDAIAEINLSIKERFDAEGWDMAFPSQTVYVAGPVKVSMVAEEQSLARTESAAR